jgi:DNA modification methylase
LTSRKLAWLTPCDAEAPGFFLTPDWARRRASHNKEDFPAEQWQEWASPVWMSINQTNVLNVRAAREASDEKHLCPLQLDVIERAVALWSNPGEVVASPFTGIGSEGYGAIKLGRKFIGAELKESYWRQAVRNLKDLSVQPELF